MIGIQQIIMKGPNIFKNIVNEGSNTWMNLKKVMWTKIKNCLQEVINNLILENGILE